MNILFAKIGDNDLTKDGIGKTYWPNGFEYYNPEGGGRSLAGLPVGWREISSEEFAESHFFIFNPSAKGWIVTEHGNATLFFMHDDIGYGMIGDRENKRVRYFKFGCRHEYQSKTVGNCLTNYACKLCGYQQTIDSSD